VDLPHRAQRRAQPPPPGPALRRERRARAQGRAGPHRARGARRRAAAPGPRSRGRGAAVDARRGLPPPRVRPDPGGGRARPRDPPGHTEVTRSPHGRAPSRGADAMGCRLIQKTLVAYYFGTAEPDARDATDAHLIACGTCLAAYLEIKRHADAQADEEPSEALFTRLRADVVA